MSASVIDLAALKLYTAEQAAVIMSGDNPGTVTTYFIAQGIRDGWIDYTPVGRHKLLTREQIAAIITSLQKPASSRTPRPRPSKR